MNGFVKYLSNLLLFWLFVFFVQRTCFLLSAFGSIADLPLLDILKSNVAAFALDMSIIGYIFELPFLLLIVSLFKDFKFIKPFVFYYFNVVLFISV